MATNETSVESSSEADEKNLLPSCQRAASADYLGQISWCSYSSTRRLTVEHTVGLSASGFGLTDHYRHIWNDESSAAIYGANPINVMNLSTVQYVLV